MLTIKTRTEGKTVTLTLRGSLDKLSSDELLDHIHKIGLRGVEKLIFDMQDLLYISSAGLRVMLIAEKALEKKGTITIRNMRQEVKQIFEDVGFTRFMEVE